MAFYLHFIFYIFFDAFVGFGDSLAFSSFFSHLFSLDEDDDDDGKSMVCDNGVQCTYFTRAIRLYPKNPNHCNNDNGYACRICEQPSSQFSFSGPYRRMHGKINSFNFRPEHQSFLLSSQNVCSILSFLELIEIQYRCAGCVECCCCSLWLPLSLSTSC